MSDKRGSGKDKSTRRDRTPPKTKKTKGTRTAPNSPEESEEADYEDQKPSSESQGEQQEEEVLLLFWEEEMEIKFNQCQLQKQMVIKVQKVRVRRWEGIHLRDQ